MPEFKRVRLTESGHEATVAEVGDGMTEIDKPAVDSQGLPLEAKFKTTVKSAASKSKTNPGGESATNKEDS